CQPSSDRHSEKRDVRLHSQADPKSQPSKSAEASEDKPTLPEAAAADAHFEATLYRLRCPPERMAEIDASRLTSQAKTPVDLQKAMAALGTVSPQYRTDQGITLHGSSSAVTLGTD